MAKLTALQIQRLYQFVQQHYVEWYDVQTELVDHLANGIERQWEINTNVIFEDALQIEFKKFGVFGFQDLLEQKVKALTLCYRKEIWFHFKSFFKLPKIILILFAMWLLYTVLHALDEKMYVLPSACAVFYLVSMWHIVTLKKAIKQRKKETGKQWLFESVMIQMGGLISILNSAIVPQTFVNANQWTHTFVLMASIGLVLIGLCLYISIKIVPARLQAKLAEQHPEYGLHIRA